jgi:transposase
MEDVLEIYALPYDSEVPLICMDEKPCYFVVDEIDPIAMSVNHPRLEDYSYRCVGSCSVFMFVVSFRGWRRVEAQGRRTELDWAHHIERLFLEFYPKAKKVRLVMDNLNTHVLGSLYEAFSAEKARSLARRLEIHYTPKHGSWLNVAECELSALSKQCLDRRIPNIEVLNTQLVAWEKDRNNDVKQVNWHFTTKQARGKLKHLHPNL